MCDSVNWEKNVPVVTSWGSGIARSHFFFFFFLFFWTFPPSQQLTVMIMLPTLPEKIIDVKSSLCVTQLSNGIK